MHWKDWFQELTPGEQLSHYFRLCTGMQKRIIDKSLAQSGIYAAQHRILALLNHKPMMSQKEIAQVMEVSTATVAVTLKKMEKNGWIEKIMDAEDNRYNKIRVTKTGKEMLDHGFHILVEIDRILVDGFTKEELHTFVNLMEQYYNRLEKMQEVDFSQRMDLEEKAEKLNSHKVRQ